MQFVNEEDVKFIRLAFCDVFGRLKNISIMPGELERAFSYGIAIDAWAIRGFEGGVKSDLFLHPDSSTLTILPWRPESGRVVRMFCDITWPDGRPFEADTRRILQKAVDDAKKAGVFFQFGSELEFYLFKRDEDGNPTKEPYDQAGYMDVAPDDRGENIRREICLMLEQMDIVPESSHHEEGPGQNEIDFHYAEPIASADHVTAFMSAVKTVANQNGLYADFSPKPLEEHPGNGMHINFSAKDRHGRSLTAQAIAGILEKITDITIFLNPVKQSYERLGVNSAPRYITWSRENRSQLVRVPAAIGNYKRAELRSPDPAANPYLAYAVLIYAGLYGIENHLELPEPADVNLYTAPPEILKRYLQLPYTRRQAAEAARMSDFVNKVLPETIIRSYMK